MLLFFFLVSFAAHWMACGWIALVPGIVTGDLASTYLKALYWVITTMTTVGYGDITPNTNAQTIYAMFVMVLGVGTYGYIIANLSNFFGNIDTAKIDFTKKMAIVNAFLAYRAIPPHLEKRIRAYYEYIWENRLDHDEDEVIDDLPDSLKTEVALFLRKPLISKVPLFRDATHDFHQEVVHHLNIHVYMPGDKVVKRGDRGDSMFFISRGNVAILDDDDEHALAVLGEGSFFGETSLLTAQPRNATVKALEFCNIYSLDKLSFDLLLKKYPRFKKVLEETSVEREHGSQEHAPPTDDT
jgi:voltage-gated potassium channel